MSLKKYAVSAVSVTGALLLGSIGVGALIEPFKETNAIIQASETKPFQMDIAYEGYGENCVLESWTYPNEYKDIGEWIAAEPENAKPVSVMPQPFHSQCEDNWNPEDVDSLPVKGKDYGYNFNLRVKDLMNPPEA